MQQTTILPVLDVRELRAGGERKQKFLGELAEAARTVGFFYVSGHELCQLQQEVMQLSKRFFDLPMEEKLAVEMVNSPHFRGYTRFQGELTQGKPDRREQFDIMDELPRAHFDDSDPQWWQLVGPNQWPQALPELQPTLLSYQRALTELTVTLLSAFAEALEQPSDIFAENVAQPYTHTKLIRYPGADDNGDRQGVGAHKDPGYLTIVTQDEHSGLEVLKDQDGWVSVPPLEGAVVVNIGELLELASDGYLRATYHRVVTPPAGVDRFSCAFFVAPQLDSEVPLLNLPADLKAQALGPSADPENPLFYQVGENVLKGRLRSHPDVAKAHYFKRAS
ncbi:isopenicillin N synthase family oxygenase [Aliidiomarina halalkaliphila]|uniref:Isopenicillin N synthase family oxygenase n=1 Tax=Aliidiomarina halalkaliphila TaxID=2593535 RepID=A0A552X063_9GAMM|nr:2-oxoglutarate and iron-dependent oxygenase domain-containing protein [Aliidiomarina halalkaliphila]TRW48404.1 isopenicillin N synthase family oxygenase [Aliidiomarina halalkaliphila]